MMNDRELEEAMWMLDRALERTKPKKTRSQIALEKSEAELEALIRQQRRKNSG